MWDQRLDWLGEQHQLDLWLTVLLFDQFAEQRTTQLLRLISYDSHNVVLLLISCSIAKFLFHEYLTFSPRQVLSIECRRSQLYPDEG